MESTASNATSAATSQGPASATEGDTSAARQTEVSREESNPLPKKYKVKVDGQDLEVDEAELLRGYGHTKAANERMRKAAEVEKKYNALASQIQHLRDQVAKDPRYLFREGQKIFGPKVDLRAAAHQEVLELARYEMMSPEEKRLYDAERERDELKSQLGQYTQAEQTNQLQALQTQIAQTVEGQMLSYFQSQGGVPDPHIVGRTVEYLIAAHQAKRPLNIAQAHKAAQRDFGEYETAAEKRLRERIAKGEIPPDFAQAVRKADVAAARTQPVFRAAAPAEQKPSKPMDIEEWFSSREKGK